MVIPRVNPALRRRRSSTTSGRLAPLRLRGATVDEQRCGELTGQTSDSPTPVSSDRWSGCARAGDGRYGQAALAVERDTRSWAAQRGPRLSS